MNTTTGTARAPRSLARLLRARLGWILVTTLVVMAGAAAYSWLRTPLYRAQAEVLVDPLVIAGVTPETPDMETEKAVVSSGLVLDPVAASLGVRERELSDGLSVTVPADSRVLRIAYSHSDPHVARQRAQALADAYVAFHGNEQVSRPSGQAGPATTTTTVGSLVGAVQGVVITPAAVPRSPATPNHLVDLAVALLVGLALGIGGAIARDRLDDRLRDADDLESQAGQPVLAVIPAYPPAEGEPASALLMVGGPESPGVTAYRNLRSLILQAGLRNDARTLLVVSPSGDGTTAVAANLAVAIARSGRRVVLVCADLERPRTHEVFGVANQIGLTAVVSGRIGVSDALFTTPVEGLLVLPAGPRSDPDTVLLAPPVQKVLDELRQQADLVIVDGPPLLAGPDAAILAESAQMVLLVADAQRSTATGVRSVARHPQVREKLIGCVLDNVAQRQNRAEPEPTDDEPNAGKGGPTPPAPRQNGQSVGGAPAAERVGAVYGEHQERSGPSNGVDVTSAN